MNRLSIIVCRIEKQIEAFVFVYVDLKRQLRRNKIQNKFELSSDSNNYPILYF